MERGADTCLPVASVCSSVPILYGVLSTLLCSIFECAYLLWLVALNITRFDIIYINTHSAMLYVFRLCGSPGVRATCSFDVARQKKNTVRGDSTRIC